jgi:hypothetical protein
VIRRFIVAVSVAVLGVFVATPVEAAEWCLHDPALVFKAPHSKQKVTIYATEGVQGALYEARLRHAKLDFEAKPGKRHGTIHLRIRSTIPGKDHESFGTVLVVSSQPFGQGVVYAVVFGRSGRRMEVAFDFVYEDPTRGP